MLRIDRMETGIPWIFTLKEHRDAQPDGACGSRSLPCALRQREPLKGGPGDLHQSRHDYMTQRRTPPCLRGHDKIIVTGRSECKSVSTETNTT
jgi:hypothetical protein